MVTTLASIHVLSSYKHAMEHVCWQQAIEIKFLALEENQIWDVAPCSHLLNLLTVILYSL